MKKVNYYVTENEFKKLKKMSEKTGLTVSEIIRRAIDEYFGKER